MSQVDFGKGVYGGFPESPCKKEDRPLEISASRKKGDHQKGGGVRVERSCLQKRSSDFDSREAIWGKKEYEVKRGSGVGP